jgi:hypothetical protein
MEKTFLTGRRVAIASAEICKSKEIADDYMP